MPFAPRWTAEAAATYFRLQAEARASLQNRQQNMDKARKMGSAIAMDPRQGVASLATAEEAGDYFQYLIDEQVSLPRQKSALLPILDEKVSGEVT